jgi:VIT1/CCC1 family predicted Fe2+/Mn2+ transporter
MQRQLLTVEESREIKGRGVCITPFLTHDQMPEPRWLQFARIECPDGKTGYARLRSELIYDATSPEKFYYACFLKNRLEQDVPAGATIWTLDDRENTLLTYGLFLAAIALLLVYRAVMSEALTLLAGFILLVLIVAFMATLQGRLVHILPWWQALRRTLALLVIAPIALGIGGLLANWWFG